MLFRVLAVALCLVAGVGCTSSIRVTDPKRTATEQFLLSKAAAGAVDQLSVDNLAGRRVYVDDAFFAAAEGQFVLGELRAKLLLHGVQLTPERDASQVVLEVRSGGVGIDRSDFLLGIPSILIQAGEDNGANTGTPVATPEIAVAKNTYQTGVASVAYVAYWRETGEVVASSGPYIGRTLREDWWLFGFGPRTVGNIPTVDPTE